MDQKNPNFNWLNDPSSGFIGGLLSSGLVTPNTSFIFQKNERIPNLKELDENNKKKFPTNRSVTSHKRSYSNGENNHEINPIIKKPIQFNKPKNLNFMKKENLDQFKYGLQLQSNTNNNFF